DHRSALLPATLADGVEELLVRVERQERRAAHLRSQFRLGELAGLLVQLRPVNALAAVLLGVGAEVHPVRLGSLVGRREAAGGERQHGRGSRGPQVRESHQEILRGKRETAWFTLCVGTPVSTLRAAIAARIGTMPDQRMRRVRKSDSTSYS